MKRLYGTLGIGVALVWGLVLLMTGMPQVQAQTNPNAPTAPNAVYLPLITEGTGVSRIKQKSGIHLGNRDSSDWREELFTRITTDTMTGVWPAAFVVRSDQIFNFHRQPKDLGDKRCRIIDAYLKLTGEGKPYNAFKHLTAAIKAGTKVIIRIAPSPGNFVDYHAPGGNHTLWVDEIPAGGNYCDETAQGGPSVGDKLRAFRDIRDIAQELSEIYKLTVGAHGWPAERLYFEPANEPNKEWYVEKGKVNPTADNRLAWLAMDDYFAALYDLAKSIEPKLQILTPSIAQDLYGQSYQLGSCDKVTVVDGGDLSGIEFMTKTFGVDLNGNLITPKADGFAIHNYWLEGQESWLPAYFPTAFPIVHFHCQAHRNDSVKYRPPTNHLMQYLSASLMHSMTRLPTFITEADLLSYCQNSDNPIQGKDNLPHVPDYASRTARSLFTFINQAEGKSTNTLTNYGAEYVIVWLLINQNPDEANTCRNADNKLYTNREINWHEAYREDANQVYEREWFKLWWAMTP